MSAAGNAVPTPPENPQAKIQPAELLLVQLEMNINHDQWTKRQSIIKKMEEVLSARHGVPNKVVSYITRFGHRSSAMATADVSPLETILSTATGAAQLNVILHSGGGDGTIVEKIVEMCRGHITGNDKKLRVIVPNLAKSAATLWAIGADQIVMGYCSELGPIDPQVQIVVSGMIQWVSALAYVESRDLLVAQINDAIKKKLPTTALLQQLASLNIPFTLEMEDQIDFAEKTATRMLEKYMLSGQIPNQQSRHRKARQIAAKLLSKALFPVHGHVINATTARDQLGLNVDILDMQDELWRLIWGYYIRAEMQLNIPLQPPYIKVKTFESGEQSMVTQDTA